MAVGVIDSTKVTRTALRNAHSITGLLLTPEAGVKPERRTHRSDRAGGGRIIFNKKSLEKCRD